ncbi:hypothetical protein B0H63DRAFT_455750 [Podospora didyma]|uniref:Uncharacterized protein n=1 Tax=Podospora didyma TaxID=330526 RepID=A0AAE0K0A9_9PEZI|nr:hypothetical protein B0H63DRAFT_455750 [Podospora didyma]
MQLTRTRSRTLWVVLLFLHVLVPLVSAQSSSAAPTFLEPNNSTSKANCSIDRDPNAIPPAPPWAFPNFYPAAPMCAATSCPTRFNRCCAAERCTASFIGACYRSGTMVSKECGCPDFNSSDCPNCDRSPLDRALYYGWLNLTCGDVKGWNGLPSGWESVFSPYDFVGLGGVRCLDTRYEPCARVCSDSTAYHPADSCNLDPAESSSLSSLSGGSSAAQYDGTAVLYSAGAYVPYLNPPPCTARDCPALLAAFNQSTVDWLEAQLLGADASSAGKDNVVFLERTHFCSMAATILNSSCPSMCSNPAERAALYLWLNNTCAGSSSSASSQLPRLLPSNWTASVAEVQLPTNLFGYGLPSIIANSASIPGCISSSSCTNGPYNLMSTVNTTFCDIDRPSGGRFCAHSPNLLSRSRFCSSLSYAATCPGSCSYPFDRRAWLEYINATCSPTVNNSSSSSSSPLPANWTALLSVLTSDLRPWPSVISPPPLSLSSFLAGNNSRHELGEAAVVAVNFDSCPSVVANLGVFAAVNVAMLVLTPILGRRTVVETLTFGILGKPHSRGWMLMGPIMACLNTAANLINVFLIKSTPGYESTDVATLMLLWFSRPRLAWLAVLLVLFQSGRAMYLSCVASALAAEIILQLLSAYAMGFAANHARLRGFYDFHRRDDIINSAGTDRGTDAMIMYAGALLWLTCVVVTVGAVAVAVGDVNAAIGSFKRLVGLAARVERRLKRRIAALVQEADDAFVRLKDEFDRLVQSPTSNGGVGGQEGGSGGDGGSHDVGKEQDALEKWRMAACEVAPLPPVQMDDKPNQQSPAWCQRYALEDLSASFQALQASVRGPEAEYRTALDQLGQGWFGGQRQGDNGMWDLGQRVDELAATINAAALAKCSNLLQMGALVEKRAGEIVLEPKTTNNRLRRIRDAKSRRMTLEEELVAIRRRWRDIAALASELTTAWSQRTQTPTSDEWVKATKARLSAAAANTVQGMLACWISQWLFWVGFVRLYTPDAYCPPKLAYMAATWIVFAVFGVPLGASY